MAFLYDVSALLALLDENHSKHPAVLEWFTGNTDDGWLSCPLTQNGYLRIVCQRRYPNPLSFHDALWRLRAAIASQNHRFIADDISLVDETIIHHQNITSHGQLTDAYLLALAVEHGARLVTLDTHIPLDAVRGATEAHLVVL